MNKVNISTLSDDDITTLFKESVRQSISKNKEQGNPVCGYDTVLKKSFILYPDGKKEYA